MISVNHYLRTSYRPDCDYVDGTVVERNSGEFEHARAQREIVIYLASLSPSLRGRVLPEQRVQVTEGRFRVPDVCVLAEDAPRQKVVTTAPALCIEILSTDDTMARIMERIEDYLAMGVPTCWIVDPLSREGRGATHGRVENVAAGGVLRARGIDMPLAMVLA